MFDAAPGAGGLDRARRSATAPGTTAVPDLTVPELRKLRKGASRAAPTAVNVDAAVEGSHGAPPQPPPSSSLSVVGSECASNFINLVSGRWQEFYGTVAARGLRQDAIW